jgi:hypothetical protein
MKKILYNIMLLLTTVTMLSSCNKDGDLIYLNGFGGSELTATTNNVVLSIANSKKLVLSMEWNNPTLLSSDSSKTAPDGVLKTYLQISANEDFSGKVNESTVISPSKAYKGDDLNSIAKDLGLSADVSAPLYFRIKSVEGNNMAPAYSNVEKVNVTPFTIHMNFVSVLNKEKTDTVARLYSDSENGVYTGYMKAIGWYNCWFVENDGTTWGNYNVSGHEFELSKASDAWNCWFADGSGHWFVTVDTKNDVWSAANITKVTINGSDFTYDSKKGVWTAQVTTTADNTQIGGTATANEYNSTTRADSSIAKTFNLPDTTIAKAGIYTVNMYINSHAQYSYEIVSGTVTPDTPTVKFPAELAMYSKDGSTKLATLAKTGTGTYAGTYAAKQWENFQIVDEENKVWYGSDPTNQYTLDSADGKYGLWFNADFTNGTTLNVTVDLNTMKWSYTK